MFGANAYNRRPELSQVLFRLSGWENLDYA